ncbi:MAG: hypothetical protein V4638_09275 [Bacteroidota bacterium]
MRVNFKSKEEISLLKESEGEILFLESGSEYQVMGFYQRKGESYFILEVHNYYPISYNAAFFEIIDSRVSQHWVLSIDYGSGDLSLMFEDWIKIPNFMNFFLDGDIDEDEKFFELREYIYYKRLIDEEFG